jgi:hypothetical protein
MDRPTVRVMDRVKRKLMRTEFAGHGILEITGNRDARRLPKRIHPNRYGQFLLDRPIPNG